MIKEVIILLMIFILSSNFVPAITGKAIEDFECSVDATNCAGLGYDEIMYGLISILFSF